ncbi:ADP-ribosylglycohydrolase family protein [Clostridium sp. SHJSY1]|uniref:ADP-ribosylglycohydrolase family protein n=1 Tax=Clostridium sp. SHJSY1 TaxID=2942483 RepID=UPI00287559EB|nr:ADP-ribosylglycohydrolase family protein [Clostridium sp. SHJSY1]MDS0525664.1 ADP-ribosylglycohydrolase family protein [Clostridium sp. SHJSY1]
MNELNSNNFEYKRNVVLYGIMGLCIGDALGVPVEFLSRESLKKKPVEEMLGYGTHNQPQGTWSDDTSLTLALIDALIEENYTTEKIGGKFIDWYYKGKYTPHGEVFDIGIATRKALDKIKNGVKAEEAGGKTEYDNGNGSLMRILPLAFYLIDEEDIEKRVKIIYEVSGITHGHIRSKVACHMYVEMAINLIKGKDLFESYINMVRALKEYYKNKLSEEELEIFHDLFSEKIGNKNENNIESSGYVIHTLEASIWCLLNTTSYKEAVLKAVNLGEDTDTTAAVTGGLAGIYYGFHGIPIKWIVCTAKTDEIYDLCNKLYRKCFELN